MPETGADNPVLICFLKIINLLLICSYIASCPDGITLKQCFPFKCTGVLLWPCRKIGHGQPKVIIYTRLVELESQMLHANFQIVFSRFWGRSFVKVFIIYRDGGHFGNVTMTI